MKLKKEIYCSIDRKNLALQIMRISKSMEGIVRDQLEIIGHYDAQHIFEIDQSKKSIYVFNQLFCINFSLNNDEDIISTNIDLSAESYAEISSFLYQNIMLSSNDIDTQNAIMMRESAESFRKLMSDQLYILVDAEHKIKNWLKNLTIVQAEIIDHLMIKAGIFKRKTLSKKTQLMHSPPSEMSLLFMNLFRLDVVYGDDFLNTQSLIESLQEISLSAQRFIPITSYRIMQLFYPQRFNIKNYKENIQNIILLEKHAEQYPHMLNFAKYIPSRYWSRSDLFAKINFYVSDVGYWDNKIQRPIFNNKQEVNWIFKQDTLVVNWIADAIQHTSSRITITALSFIDCGRFHSSIILATMQFFQFISARLFILSCEQYANKEISPHVFDHLTASVLYLDEWLAALNLHILKHPNAMKVVYTNLSRLMQAYMEYLDDITHDLPQELLTYILPDSQQSRQFVYQLKRYNITLDDFRQRFYLRQNNIKELIFDSYVRDYLVTYLTENYTVRKNITWFGLFKKSIIWHHQVQKDEMLEKLKQKYLGSTWSAFYKENVVEFNHWKFEELKNLDQIIAESQHLRHCLAESYTPQIVQGNYVAFHMSSPCLQQHLTLGCHLIHGELLFDQLEYSNNKKAEQVLVSIAKQFIDQLNQKKKIIK